MDASLLITREPFSNLYSIDLNIVNAIAEDMAENGFDGAYPIVVWDDDGELIVIDGHTRLIAARRLSIDDIPIDVKYFLNEDDAVIYAVHIQRDRRNLSEGDLLRLVEVIDKRKQRGGDRRSEEVRSKSAEEAIKAQDCTLKKEAERTAKTIGVSTRKIEQTRTVIDHAPPAIKEAVKSGEKSINKAYQETQEIRKAETGVKSKPIFNQTNDNIEWARWTWNPVTGCLHNCPYCYARDIANRFYGGFKPEFHVARLQAPFNTKRPNGGSSIGDRNVFVCSMADLFGMWVPQEWIDSVLDVVRRSPEWNYLFLTKNPRRYVDIKFPINAWVGATADTNDRAVDALKVFAEMAENGNRPTVTFLSCEPLLESIQTPLTNLIVDWVIIGGRSKNSQLPELQPEWDWVETLFHFAREGGCRVYFKPNLTVRPREYPQ